MSTHVSVKTKHECFFRKDLWVLNKKIQIAKISNVCFLLQSLKMKVVNSETHIYPLNGYE